MLKKRVISGIIMAFAVLLPLLLDRFWFSIVVGILFLWAVIEILSVSAKRTENKGIFHSLFLVIYVYFSLNFAVTGLRWHEGGWWLILALAGTTAYDTVAFFVGRGIGKRKITPKISPNKTWEGTLGGFIGSLSATLVIGTNFLSLSWMQIIVVGILIGILAFLGDLIFSWYKRQLGVKDMGKLIPGHGGLLDRMDSHLLVFAGLFLYLVAV